MKTTYTLEQAEIVQAVTYYLAHTLNVPIEKVKVDLKITDAQPYYNPFDAGSPSSVKVSATVES